MFIENILKGGINQINDFFNNQSHYVVFLIFTILGFILTMKDKRILKSSNSPSKELSKHSKMYMIDNPEVISRAIINNSTIGVAIIQDQRYVFINPRFAQTLDMSIKELLNLSPNEIWNLVYPDDHEILIRRNSDLEDELEVSPKLKFRYVKPNKSICWVESSIVRIMHNGKPVNLILEEDITKDVEAEKRLIKDDERYKTLFNRIPIGLYRTDIDGNFLYANEEFLKIFGIETDGEFDFDNFTTSDLYSKYPRDKIIEEMSKYGQIKGYEVEVLKKNGEKIFIRENSKFYYDEDKDITYFEGSVEDITQNKIIESELSKKSKALTGRMNELSILYRFSKMSIDSHLSIEESLEFLLDILPLGLQYPKLSCSRILFDNLILESKYFKESEWKISSNIEVDGQCIGVLEVFYLEKMPKKDFGPFIKEEKDLINALTREISSYISKMNSKKELQIKSEISNVFLYSKDEELFTDVLTILSRATGSDYGIFGYLDSSHSWICQTMTSKTLNKCKIDKKSKITSHRFWEDYLEEIILKKKSMVINSGFDLPKEHILISRILNVPITYQNEIIGNIVVGNKETDYTPSDQKLLESIANYISPILHARVSKITEENQKRRAERKLKESEEKFKAIFQNANDGIILLHQDLTKIFMVNEQFCKMLGYSEDEVLNSSIDRFYSNAKKSEIEQNFNEIFQKGNLAIQDIPFLKKNDEVLWVDINTSNFTINEDVIYLGVIRDINIRKKAEEAIIRSRDSLAVEVKRATKKINEEKNRIEAILETSPNAIIVFDNYGKVLLLNNAFKILSHQINSDKFRDDLIIDESVIKSFQIQLFELSQTKTVNTIIIEPKKGFHVQILSSNILNLNSSVIGTIMVLIDVSPFVELEKNQRKLIMTISHELRTPITSIDLSVQNLIRYGSRMNGERTNHLYQVIHKNTSLLNEMVDKTFILSKIDSDDYKLIKEKVIIIDILKASVVKFESHLKKKKIDFKIECDPTVELIGDVKKLNRVFQILINNAIKFSPENSDIQLILIDQYRGEFNLNNQSGILIEVIDKGVGIKETDLLNIFKPFYKTKESREIQGLGIGLTLAKRIIELHGGEIFVQSKIGEGSTFSIFIPYK